MTALDDLGIQRIWSSDGVNGRILSGYVPWRKWSDSSELKEAFAKPPALSYYDSSKPLLVATDASGYAIASIVFQSEGRAGTAGGGDGLIVRRDCEKERSLSATDGDRGFTAERTVTRMCSVRHDSDRKPQKAISPSWYPVPFPFPMRAYARSPRRAPPPPPRAANEQLRAHCAVAKGRIEKRQINRFPRRQTTLTRNHPRPPPGVRTNDGNS
ncbi:uncharacterized protein KD926_003211 [Aspergillus affinis]|uniref:uncharacterized protein n=1 Tax=Aspergillus affinis TaxID=1070780 RepID=UPI0022FE9254|nr:uncharacterized protein KD926_003211 [Aspergillus affinis]KAI9035607.1 hypothetical protein KD926_003211 [Aspergillus affinis]